MNVLKATGIVYSDYFPLNQQWINSLLAKEPGIALPLAKHQKSRLQSKFLSHQAAISSEQSDCTTLLTGED